MILAAAAPDAPPAPAAAQVAPMPVNSNHVVLGVANPEWLHVGFESRTDQVGFSLCAGTLGMAYDLSLGLRYFLGQTDGGFYGEAGVSLVRMFALSDVTPQSWSPLGFVGVGYQLVIGHFLANVGVGLSPWPLPASANQPIFVTNAQALPRLVLQFGYVL